MLPPLPLDGLLLPDIEPDPPERPPVEGAEGVVDLEELPPEPELPEPFVPADEDRLADPLLPLEEDRLADPLPPLEPDLPAEDAPPAAPVEPEAPAVPDDPPLALADGSSVPVLPGSSVAVPPLGTASMRLPTYSGSRTICVRATRESRGSFLWNAMAVAFISDPLESPSGSTVICHW